MLCTQKRRADATTVFSGKRYCQLKSKQFSDKKHLLSDKSRSSTPSTVPVICCVEFVDQLIHCTKREEPKTNVKTCLEVKPMTSSKNNHLISIYTIVCCFSPCLSDTNATCLPLTSTKPFREVDVLCRIQTEPNWI